MSRHVKPTDLTAMVTGRVALAGIIGLVGVAACSSKGLIFSTRKDPLPAEGGAPPKTGNGPGVIHVVPRGDGGECGPFRIDPVQSAPRAPGLLLLVDVSSGMSEPVDMSTWWTTTVSGILDFLAPPKTGFSVGFQFFPAQTVPDACNFAYDAPDIDIGAVDDARGSFINSLVNQKLEGPNTLAPALRGALLHMRDWAAKQSRPAAVVILTHGAATGCPPAGLDDIARVAADAVGSDPKVTTYVIGLGATMLNVYQIAHSGGTANPPMIMSDVKSGVALALGTIVTDLNCSFPVQKPPRSQIAGVTINVLNTPTSAPPRNGPAECDPKMGGFYVSPGPETRVTFCPASCAALQYARVDVNFDCTTAGK